MKRICPDSINTLRASSLGGVGYGKFTTLSIFMSYKKSIPDARLLEIHVLWTLCSMCTANICILSFLRLHKLQYTC